MILKHNGVYFMVYTFPTYGMNNVNQQFTKKNEKNSRMHYAMLYTLLILV